MAESNPSSPLPGFGSIEELVQFFDAEDMGEYIPAMPEAEFEVDLRERRYLMSIDQDLMKKVTEIARARNVSAASLVDAWLREKVTG